MNEVLFLKSEPLGPVLSTPLCWGPIFYSCFVCEYIEILLRWSLYLKNEFLSLFLKVHNSFWVEINAHQLSYLILL